LQFDFQIADKDDADETEVRLASTNDDDQFIDNDTDESESE
jgi:hypothetical protein